MLRGVHWSKKGEDKREDKGEDKGAEEDERKESFGVRARGTPAPHVTSFLTGGPTVGQ